MVQSNAYSWHIARLNDRIWLEQKGKWLPVMVRKLGRERVTVTLPDGKHLIRPYGAFRLRKEE